VITAPIGPDGRTVAPGQAEPQARRCLEVITQALAGLGASPADVVRTRIFLTHAEDFPVVAKVHGQYFRAAPPVATAVVVAGLLDSDWRVEIEAEAILRNG
jgi:enamine deaminase RidA (YjgF/YER057c/UK114 family)